MALISGVFISFSLLIFLYPKKLKNLLIINIGRNKIIANAKNLPPENSFFIKLIESDQKLDALLQNLVKIGLAGIEVYYPGHSPRQIRQYMQLADRCGLLMTGGTDFHGTITPQIKMGSGKGSLFIPYSLYEKLLGARAQT